MAPVFSRQALSFTDPYASCRVPVDIIIEISALLGRSDLRSMLLSCWRFHDIVAPNLYRHLEAWLPPRGWDGSEGDSRLSFRLLTSLVRSAYHANPPSATQRYASYVLTFRYISHDTTADLRAFPLFTEFLRFAHRLRHITLDVDSDSVPLVLDSLHRHHITCATTRPLLHERTLSDVAFPWTLPRLDSIRSSKASIASALMRYRNIRTIIVDTLPSAADLGSFLDNSSAIRGAQLLRLSITLPYNVPACVIALQAVSLAFSSLRFLSLRTSSKIAEEFFEDLLALYNEEDYLLPQLRFFSLNLASGPFNHTDLMKASEDQVVMLGKDRQSLETLVFGNLMWHRENLYMAWKLSKRSTLRRMQWNGHRASLSLHTRRTPGLSRLHGMIDDFVTRDARLSAFEIFLLGSDTVHVDAFFAGWTPDLILWLRPLSSSMRLAVQAYCTRQWNVDTFLSRWFRFPSGFLKTLEQCGGLISGSEAQQFFGRRAYRGRDLDIYVPLHGLLPMGRWLREEGFAFHASAEKHPLFDVAAMMFTSHIGVNTSSPPSFLPPRRTTTFSAFNFVRTPHPNRPVLLSGSHVQLIAVTYNPVEFIINNFHSTAVMNYMTDKYAISLFPRTTFIEKTSLICQDITRHATVHQAWMKKYRKRGFKILGAGDSIPATTELRKWDRTVGDALTWVLPFSRQVVLGQTSSTSQIYRFQFEALPYFYEVAATGAALRVAPRFISMAIVANPYIELGGYRSVEIVAGFGDYFGDEEDLSDDSDATDE
ncbi:hypothetical protein FKP32DRAFT_1674545 [Trametes sanguinea]|nr:hypothetical protein FKP32DRAFT_1674545 [Trametes sanguinea]